MNRFEENYILLIEDSPLDAELAMSTLTACSYVKDVIWLTDGQKAVDYLFCEGEYAERDGISPRLILLDLRMPRMSGIEVLEIIKADARTRSIPVVVMTSSQEDADLKRTYALGVNSYVVKPLHLHALTKVMNDAAHYWLNVNKSE